MSICTCGHPSGEHAEAPEFMGISAICFASGCSCTEYLDRHFHKMKPKGWLEALVAEDTCLSRFWKGSMR